MKDLKRHQIRQAIIVAAMDDQTNDSAAVESFTLHIPQGDIDDLKQRIAQTRWADKEVTDGSFQGTPLSMAQKVASYWKDEYDWRRFEQEVNQYPQ
jgi:epoxide hydrolase